MLSTLRDELEISFKEHTILEHHETLKPYWYNDNYYERERNYLIASGILHPIEGGFVIAEDTVPLIRRTWGIVLTTEQYKRIMEEIPSSELTEILKKNEIQISGTIEEKVVRIIDNYISPKNVLGFLSVDIVKEIARKKGSFVSGSKSEIIDNLIDYMDDDEDLRKKEEIEKKFAPPSPEKKVLSFVGFNNIFIQLSNEQLYLIADSLRKINKSGTKERKVQHLWDSLYSEVTLLNQLSNSELYDLCAKLNLKVSGAKQDKIERVVDAYIACANEKENNQSELDTETLISISTHSDIEREKKNESINDLKEKYPFLSNDELIILSFLIENKSASGPVIERLIARFNIPWYFPETQMSEMVKKMQENGYDIILVKKFSDYPLYQLK
jgi:hypothetical protein